MTTDGKNIAVIGSGPMGLMCAYELLKKGHRVDLFERDDRIGGMSASFDFDGLRIERYYHFICREDRPLLALLEELGISHLLRWRDTRMGFYYNGKLYAWGDPVALLRFPKLDFLSKCRYALHVLYCKYIKDWSVLDRKDGVAWIKKWIGEKAYAVLWDSLLRLKYHNMLDKVSAAWIAARIQRLAKSRKSVFTETLGYIEGGSESFLNAIRMRIESLGGHIHLRADVKQVVCESGRVKGVTIGDEMQPYDMVVSTVPLPYLLTLVPALPAQAQQQIRAIHNIGVACVVLKLSHSVSSHFWMNINDPDIGVPGIIEYSNLCPLDQSIVYFPYYMDASHAKYGYTDAMFLKEVTGYLQKICPDFSVSWIIASHVSRYQFAQTVCPPGFFQALPPMKSAVEGFYMADTSYYYPEDRSISESIRVGRMLADLI